MRHRDPSLSFIDPYRTVYLSTPDRPRDIVRRPDRRDHGGRVRSRIPHHPAFSASIPPIATIGRRQ